MVKIKQREEWLMPNKVIDGHSADYKIIEIDARQTKGGEDWIVFKICPLDDMDREILLSSWALQPPKGQELDLKVNHVIKVTKKKGLDSRLICELLTIPVTKF